MRRLYRPGAPLDVKLYFPVYEGTLEESALDLIGAKMLAAQCFYGDEVSGALVEEGDDEDLLSSLVRKAFGGIEIGRAEGIFSNGSVQQAGVTESPLGSPVAVSPQVEITAPPAGLMLPGQALGRARLRKRRKAPVVLNGQIPMF